MNKVHIRRSTDLCTYLQNILEGDTGFRELALQDHDDIVVVLVNLLCYMRLWATAFVLLDICLKGGDLSIEICDILFNNKG